MSNHICFILVFLNGQSLVRVALKLDRENTPDDVIKYYMESSSHEYFMSVLPDYFKSYGKIVEITENLLDIVDAR